MTMGAWIAAALLAAAPAKDAGAAKDEVLVIGVRTPQGLSTWLVDATGIHKAGDGVAVPRADGWWRLAWLSRKKDKTEETAIWTTPGRKPISTGSLDADPSCEQSSEEDLLFAGSDYYSVESQGGGYCAGAAHPWHHRTLVTFRMDPKDHKPVAIGAVLGGLGTAAVEKAQATAHGGPEKRQADCLGDPSDQAWGLIRAQGRWVVRGALPYAYEACRQNYEYFTLDVPADPKVVGVAPAPRPWSEYARAHPGLTDVVVSPSGAFELAVSPTGLEVFVGGKSVARQALEKPALVLTQLALGKAASRWRDDVIKELAP